MRIRNEEAEVKKIVEKNIFGAKSFMHGIQKNEIIADKVSVTFSGLIILVKNIILQKYF